MSGSHKNYVEDYYKNKSTRDNAVKQYRDELFDLDNSIVISSCISILANQRILPLKMFKALEVGPIAGYKWWCLGLQCLQKLTQDDYQRPYIFFSLPVNEGKHSIAIVIDNEKKEIYCIDSLANEKFKEEALGHLEPMRDQLFANYKIVMPLNPKRQQRDGFLKKEWSCGVQTIANIVGIIRQNEIDKLKSANAPAQHYKYEHQGEEFFEPINLANNIGIARRSEANISAYLAICLQSKNDYTQQIDSFTAKDPNYNLKDIFLRIVSGVYSRYDSQLSENLSEEQKNNLKEILSQLHYFKYELEKSMNENLYNSSVSLADFIKTFSTKNPTHSISAIMLTPKIADSLARTADDKVYETVKTDLRAAIDNMSKERLPFILPSAYLASVKTYINSFVINEYKKDFDQRPLGTRGHSIVRDEILMALTTNLERCKTEEDILYALKLASTQLLNNVYNGRFSKIKGLFSSQLYSRMRAVYQSLRPDENLDMIIKAQSDQIIAGNKLHVLKDVSLEIPVTISAPDEKKMIEYAIRGIEAYLDRNESPVENKKSLLSSLFTKNLEAPHANAYLKYLELTPHPLAKSIILYALLSGNKNEKLKEQVAVSMGYVGGSPKEKIKLAEGFFHRFIKTTLTKITPDQKAASMLIDEMQKITGRINNQANSGVLNTKNEYGDNLELLNNVFSPQCLIFQKARK